jgi:hypothetical protein
MHRKTCHLASLTAIMYLLCTVPAHSQTPATGESGQPIAASSQVSAQAPTEAVMSSFKKTVVFLKTNCLEQDPKGNPVVNSYSGTGFLLGVQPPDNPNKGVLYLVTNHHVATPGIEHGKPCKIPSASIRFNLNKPTATGELSQELPLEPSAWMFPADPSVDLAIMLVALNQEIFSFKLIPSTLLMSEKDAKAAQVAEGDTVIFAGLFVQFQGKVRNEPIVREGKVAMMADEPTPTTLGLSGKVYLVDAHAFGGNSGSPMLLDLGGARNGNLIAGQIFKLFGVVSGYVQETSDLNLQAVASYAGTITANSGIATVVPAQQLLNLLDLPNVKAQREAILGTLPK